VGACIAQRAFERKQTPSEVCLKKWQFSCWNGKKLKDLEHLLKVPQAKYAITVAKNVKNLSRGFIGYANHYHATWMKKKPYWAKGQKPVKVIGQHAFYKLWTREGFCIPPRRTAMGEAVALQKDPNLITQPRRVVIFSAGHFFGTASANTPST